MDGAPPPNERSQDRKVIVVGRARDLGCTLAKRTVLVWSDLNNKTTKKCFSAIRSCSATSGCVSLNLADKNERQRSRFHRRSWSRCCPPLVENAKAAFPTFPQRLLF